MCGRYSIFADVDEIEERFDVDTSDIEIRPRYNLAPTQPAPVIINDPARVVRLMRWGLVPSWANDVSIGNRMINARADTLTEKPSFKKSLERRRCLVPADGFFEWKKEGRVKIPTRFVLKSRELFAFAGLWDRWVGPGGDEVISFTIVTTEPNELIRPIHNRMPVILPKEREETWLDSDHKQTTKLTSLLVPFPADRMESYVVSPAVNSPKNDTEVCVKPIQM